MTIYALLIEWNPETGIRAGNINPQDPNLKCSGWQNMEVNPALELRIIEDNRDTSQYKEIKGVTILEGRDEINTTINNNFPAKILIEDELLYTEHFKEQINDKQIKISTLPDDRIERLKILKNKYHIKGIQEIKPNTI